jgi:hypothetical protein
MSKQRSRSLQDILKHRQQEDFVGKTEQLAFFRRNLRYEPGDDRHRFIISVSRQGGVSPVAMMAGHYEEPDNAT